MVALPSNRNTSILPFFVNDGLLEPSEISLLRASDPSLPVDELRRRFDDDGYLFLKGLLPRSDVLKAREEYFKFLSPTGVLQPGTSPVDGIYDSAKDVAQFPGIGSGAAGKNGHPGKVAAEFVDLALRAHGEKWYAEDFCKHPVLLEFVAGLTGWEEHTVAFRRTLLRNNIPGTKAIGVHYDQIFLRYGEPTSVTAWVPMGDIGLTGGGLIYLENGAQLGKQFENEFAERAKTVGLTDEEAKSAFNKNMLSTGLLSESPAEFGRAYDRRWLVTDYRAGDVVLHNPYAIHASTLNHDPDHVIRLATDLRFADSRQPWDERWSTQYTLGDGV
ncbi:hypothetical protein OIDMADRAFT_100270 [Oidiodendron maius Zn]|uniref:Uncharacterized protein n=1 Tax=Oidiodendron maius (strain Zn) TaxID=913774 RepID=A0A0C3I0D0_OIDMZ|nr:hypothetical protein OIDMADRAFT_100270 [Oidiodendron maius Zn]